MTVSPSLSPSLLAKYNKSGPRYTSYPTALLFHEEIENDLIEQAARRSPMPGLSLYVHIPFCKQLCYYCGCNKVVTRHQHKADRYLEFLLKEIAHRADAFGHYQVEQIHLGGGTPSFLTLEQQAVLMDAMRQSFSVSDDAEISIEIDPRGVSTAYIDGLKALGYNRISIGLQDVNEQVQEAINRVQSTEHIHTLIAHAQATGFSSVNVDLIYGLPHQTLETFTDTLTAVLAMDVDRISLFNYAHLPDRFAAQRKIKNEWLPDGPQKTQLMDMAMAQLLDAGYVMIGMDHFAKPDDELSRALARGELHRNFQGYTTQGDLDMLGLGVSSISAVYDVYGQNPKTLNAYYEAIDAGTQITEKGCLLTTDDRLRRHIIMELMCNLSLNIADVEEMFEINFAETFGDELMELAEFQRDGLVTITRNKIMVHPQARLIIRVICMTFDAYLAGRQARYSRIL